MLIFNIDSSGFCKQRNIFMNDSLKGVDTATQTFPLDGVY